MVYFNADANINDVLENGAAKDTPLTAWFKINQTNTSWTEIFLLAPMIM